MTNNTSATTKALVVTRVFDAPVELVWKAWTDPNHVMRWWGPNYFTSPYCKMDFREGGMTVVAMRGPDGHDHFSAWNYNKIIPMERIEYIQDLTDKDGVKVDPVAMGLPDDFPQGIRTVLLFKAMGNKTEMTIMEYGYPDSHMFELAEMGLNQSLDKMAATFTEA